MSVGTPVIGCRTGGMVEIVESGKNGLLVESGDSDGLASAMEQLLSDRELKERLVSAGYTTVREKFDPASFVEQVADVYSSCCRAVRIP
jgi:glycosyltransferase involved in cell wall biosynthesis